MPIGWFLTGIPQHWTVDACWPIVQFVLITAHTAVDQVVEVICAPLALGAKMIDSQLAAGVRLADTTELTGKVSTLADL